MIREATINDLNQLALLFDLYRQFYQQESNIALASDFLRKRLENKESKIFVASSVKENTIAGFVQLYPTFSSIGLKNTWILNDLFVSPHHRGEGWGEKLIKQAINFSESTGARSLMLQTGKSNVAAQRLYERLGWAKDEKYFTYYYTHKKD